MKKKIKLFDPNIGKDEKQKISQVSSKTYEDIDILREHESTPILVSKRIKDHKLT